MSNPISGRPGSAAAGGRHASPIPPSPRPAVASRSSRSSLRREHERQEAPLPPHLPPSVPRSPPQSPQAFPAPALPQEPPPPSSPSPVQPSFSPLFALISSTSNSSNRQTIHHPTVHYIFADDDPAILTDALAQYHRGTPGSNGHDGGDSDGPADRAVILDMEPTPDGTSVQVAWASSLSPDWAVTSARVSRMEGSDGGVVSGPSGGLVLKIEGVSIEPSMSTTEKTPTPEADLQSSTASLGRQQLLPAPERYADLLQEFEKQMATLRRVVEAGEARQRALGDGGEEFTEAAQ